MSKFITIILIVLYTLLSHANAQISPSKDDSTLPATLTIIIGILSILFSAVFILVVYAKFCHRNSHPHGEPEANIGLALLRSSSRFSGIDQKVIDSLPFFRFSSLKGSREGLECAVCLSKFENIEVLRLLPKCKHAFHINCIDHWLERHSSCPLCRRRISAEDVAFFVHSNGTRFMRNQPELPSQDSNIELFVEREEDHQNSSRFSIGSSFRKTGKGNKEKEILIQNEADGFDCEEKQKVFHKHKHKIVVSDFVFMNRWSNLNPSDLLLLNTEMLGAMSSNRFSSLEHDTVQWSATSGTESEKITKIKEEMEMKRSFERRISIADKNSIVSITGIPYLSDSKGSTSETTNLNERRSVSDTTAFLRDISAIEAHVTDDRIRRIWLPIARRTVQRFANKERRSKRSRHTQQPDV